MTGLSRSWTCALAIGLLIAGGWEPGQAQAPAQTPAVTIDAGAPLAPMSKYIYGQFIEHLGRCIYGGIWAEMLEDRKFYYPITPQYAPYGPAGA